MQNVRPHKNRVRLRGFPRPSAPDRHRARNLSRPGQQLGAK